MGAHEANELSQVRGIRQVIDLRTEAEAAGTECSLTAPCQRLSVPLFTSFRPDWIHPPDQRPEATALRYLEMVEDGLPSIGRIVLRLSDEGSPPALIHCAVGRDRTGIVIAFLLDLLEVPDEEIAADYALSDGIVQDGERARAETIHILLDLLRAQYGSGRDMLLTSGVAPHSIEQLRKNLVERP